MTESELEPRQQAAWSSYQRMRVQLAGRLSRELAQASGLSEADYEILVALSEAPDGSVRALALRCGLEWEKSRLSHQLRRMEARGLVERSECVEDSRGSVIQVTQLGRAAVVEARRHYDEAVRRYVVDVLTPDQIEALGTIAETILGKLERSHRS